MASGWEDSQREIMAATFEELAETIRSSASPAECVPNMVRVMLTAVSMLGQEAEAIFSLVALPFGGVEALKALGQGDATE